MEMVLAALGPSKRPVVSRIVPHHLVSRDSSAPARRVNGRGKSAILQHA
jgi:hypothetical protein